MAIIINLDVMMAKRKKGLTELAGEVDITLANLSILDCQPGDILQYVEDEEEDGAIELKSL